MKNILILEPSTSGLELLVNAHAMGLRVFVLSANRDERIIPEYYDAFIFQKIIVDTNDLHAITQATLKIQQTFPLSAVIPGFEIFVELAAELSRLVKVPGLSALTGAALRNKGTMRETLKKSGVRVPYFQIIDSPKALADAASTFHFPVVIKPIDQSGSVHVSRVNDLEALQNAYDAMCQDTWTEMGKGVGSIAIIEEYIEGDEFSVEGFVDASGVHIVSITEKLLGPEPFFVELGHIVPANITEEKRHAIARYVKDVVAGVRLTVGVFHAELRVDQKGPVLMEIAGRLAGDKICDLIFLATGVNLYQIMLQCHLGQLAALPKKIDKRVAGIQYFTCTDKTSYQKMRGLDALKALPGFQQFKVAIQANQTIPPLTSFQGRVAHCIFTAPTYAELRLQFDLALSRLSFL